MEWVHPAGEIEWCGGIAVMRASAFREVGGFDSTLIAGEEPDLCSRLRSRGHRLRLIAHDMALHDVGLTTFSQWWTRNIRTGHAYAEAIARRPDAPAMHAASQVRSIAFWGLWLPGLSVALAPPTLGASLLASATGYPALLVRVYRGMRERGFTQAEARTYAVFCVLAKFPQAWGLVRYQALRRKGKDSDLIEHKRPA
jgi:hypothetical protein